MTATAVPPRPTATSRWNELLSVPPSALWGVVKEKTTPTPWRVEAWLAGAGAVAIGVSGIATTTTELATILLALSGAGLVALLVAEARARRRWTVR